jgi:hypothetical protein
MNFDVQNLLLSKIGRLKLLSGRDFFALWTLAEQASPSSTPLSTSPLSDTLTRPHLSLSLNFSHESQFLISPSLHLAENFRFLLISPDLSISQPLHTFLCPSAIALSPSLLSSSVSISPETAPDNLSVTPPPRNTSEHLF